MSVSINQLNLLPRTILVFQKRAIRKEKASYCKTGLIYLITYVSFIGNINCKFKRYENKTAKWNQNEMKITLHTEMILQKIKEGRLGPSNSLFQICEYLKKRPKNSHLHFFAKKNFQVLGVYLKEFLGRGRGILSSIHPHILPWNHIHKKPIVSNHNNGYFSFECV